jgi:outer membrane protein assembly factor BamB
MFVLRTIDGQLIETVPNVLAAPAFRADMGYFTRPGGVMARSIATGQTLWHFRAVDGLRILPPIVVNGKVLIASGEGTPFVKDALTGKHLQKIALGVTFPGSREDSITVPLAGLGAGGGSVFVPAGTKLFAFRGGKLEAN